MLVTNESLQQVDNHWAVLAVGEKNRDRGLRVAEARLVRTATHRQMELSFNDRPTDDDLLQRLAMAYEVAATEGLDSLLHPSSENEELQKQAQAGASRAFEIRRLVAIPDDIDAKIFHVLHLASLAYCGDRWADLRRWIKENQGTVKAPSVAKEPWDKRVLYRVFDCWIRLFRKESWDDLHRIHEIVAGLREDQKQYEQDVLTGADSQKERVMALRLVALYNWAKATELLATYVAQGSPSNINTSIDRHFSQATEALPGSKDPALEVILKWLHVASRRMIAGSIWWGVVVSRTVKQQIERNWVLENDEEGLAGEEFCQWLIRDNATDNCDVVASIPKTLDEEYDNNVVWPNGRLIAAAPLLLRQVRLLTEYLSEAAIDGAYDEQIQAAEQMLAELE